MKNLDRKDLKSLLTLNRFLFERGAGEESPGWRAGTAPTVPTDFIVLARERLGSLV